MSAEGQENTEPEKPPEVVSYEGNLYADGNKNTYAVDAEGHHIDVSGDEALAAFGHNEEERKKYVQENPELKAQWEADQRASPAQEFIASENSQTENETETGEQVTKDIFDDFADAVREGYGGNFKQWDKENRQREEAKWMTFVRPAGEASLSGLDSVFGGQEALKVILATEAGRELVLDYLSSEKGKTRITEAIQGTAVDLENRRNEELNQKAGDPNPTDEDIFQYVMKKTSNGAQPEQISDEESEETVVKEPIDEDDNRRSDVPAEPEEGVAEGASSGVGEELEPTDEVSPGISDPLEVQPGEEATDDTGNAAPGRLRAIWNRVRRGYVDSTYRYVTGENISAEEQGNDRRSRLTKRGIGALVLVGAGAGLSYLAYKGIDSGGGPSAHSAQEVQFFHAAAGNHGVGIEVPSGYNLAANSSGHYDLIGPNKHIIFKDMQFDKMGNVSRHDREVLRQHGFKLYQNKLSYVGKNGKSGVHFITDVESH